jgi:hypothetical protein
MATLWVLSIIELAIVFLSKCLSSTMLSGQLSFWANVLLGFWVIVCLGKNP